MILVLPDKKNYTFLGYTFFKNFYVSQNKQVKGTGSDSGVCV